MSTAQFTALKTDEAAAVLRWRIGRLVAAGFGPDDALVVATHVEVDLHLAAELLERGCPPATALRILL